MPTPVFVLHPSVVQTRKPRNNQGANYTPDAARLIRGGSEQIPSERQPLIIVFCPLPLVSLQMCSHLISPYGSGHRWEIALSGPGAITGVNLRLALTVLPQIQGFRTLRGYIGLMIPTATTLAVGGTCTLASCGVIQFVKITQCTTSEL